MDYGACLIQIGALKPLTEQTCEHVSMWACKWIHEEVGIK